jgi:ribosome-associated heat shock protein Hsp15
MTESRRVDQWLWYARFFKTRTLAAKTLEAGKVRINGERVSKIGQAVRADDVLTFPQGRRVRVIQVCGIGTRRGPAPEAATLYLDLAPPEDRATTTEKASSDLGVPQREPGSGRPTKADRRAMDRIRGAEKP